MRDTAAFLTTLDFFDDLRGLRHLQLTFYALRPTAPMSCEPPQLTRSRRDLKILGISHCARKQKGRLYRGNGAKTACRVKNGEQQDVRQCCVNKAVNNKEALGTHITAHTLITTREA